MDFFLSDDEPAAKKSRGGPSLADSCRLADFSGVKVKSKCFSGKEICVMNGTRVLTKEELQKQVAAGGGSLTLNPSIKSAAHSFITDFNQNLHLFCSRAYVLRCSRQARRQREQFEEMECCPSRMDLSLSGRQRAAFLSAPRNDFHHRSDCS